jgi:hypothetical protein
MVLSRLFCVCCDAVAFADDTTSLFSRVFYREIRENNNIANITIAYNDQKERKLRCFPWFQA